ncbi:MAG TPA: hypothetical protein VFK47_21670 [Ktedonobacteraceae bacterium]|nr:hypothetical protein [Ktedonobacteraceae bacterium]
MADLLQVPVADLYLWHHRALQALHKQMKTAPIGRRGARGH